MNHLRTAVVLATTLGLGSFGLGSLAAQEAKPEPVQPKQEVAPSVDRWIADLGDSSFRTRLRAENELRKVGASALPALRHAAEQSDDAEVQWRARRLVRQIERGDGRGLVQRSPQDDAGQGQGQGRIRSGEDLGRQFDDLFRQMEDRFGLDIPRASFFHDDFFRDLQAQVQNGVTRAQGLSMEIGPDGAVRVEVQETDADGKAETKVYEAPDMDTFRAQYPDVLQRGGLGFGGLDLRLWGSGQNHPDPFFRMPRGFVDRAFGQPWPGQGAVPPRDDGVDAPAEMQQQVRSGQRLGVAVHAQLPPELREHLGLDEGVGLMVQSVSPDSLAATLGLQAGDIVTRIGSHRIGSPDDVQGALAAIEAGADVPVTLLRKGAEHQATAKKPAAATPSADAPKTKQLRRRSAADEPAQVR